MGNSNDDRIREYLDGQLSGKELIDFEMLLERDPKLAEEVESLKFIESALESAGADAFRNELEMWDTEAKKVKTRILAKQVWAVAAGILLLITTWIFVFQPKEYTAEQLYAQYFSPYSNMITSRDEIAETDLGQGMEAYSQEDYDEAVRFLADYLNGGGTQTGAKLYLGISLLKIGDVDEAESNLSDLLGHPLFGQQAEWYLGLLSLKNGDKRRAEEILSRIAQSEGHYQRQLAREILQKW